MPCRDVYNRVVADHVVAKGRHRSCVLVRPLEIHALTVYAIDVHRSAAEVLAQLILSKARLFARSSVVELGCGSGLAGVMCSKFAKCVLFTDANADAIELAAGNAALNQPKSELPEAAVASLVMPSPPCDTIPAEASSCSISSSVLRWGVDDDAVVAAHGVFDFVVASEVLYVHWVCLCCCCCMSST